MEAITCPTTTRLFSEEELETLLKQMASTEFETNLVQRYLTHIVQRHMDPGMGIGVFRIVTKIHGVLNDLTEQYKADKKRADMKKTLEFTKKFVFCVK